MARRSTGGGTIAHSLRPMFLLAQVGSGVYNLLLILHILAVVVAFAPAVVHPLVGRRLLGDEGAARQFSGAASINSRTVHLPALMAVALLGFALVGVSDSAFKFSDPWVAISALLWLVIGGVVSAMVAPGERGMAAGEAGAASKVQIGGGIVTVLFVVVLCLMVVKPG